MPAVVKVTNQFHLILRSGTSRVENVIREATAEVIGPFVIGHMVLRELL